MTMSIDAQRCIREMHARGCSGRGIARSLGISRNTVAKYVGKGDFSPAPPVARESRRPSIDPYAGTVRSWLEADAGAPRKQRHTARRACDRLVAEEGYEGSLSTVERFVREWGEARRGPGDGFLELEWPAGSAQVDYGECFADIGGARERLHALVVSFPHSNARLEVSPGRRGPRTPAGPSRRSSTRSAAPRASSCSTTPPSAGAGSGTRSARARCSPRCGRTTAAPPPTAAPTRATRRGRSRTPPGSSAGT